jgi:outer membrane immunogenic protein
MTVTRVLATIAALAIPLTASSTAVHAQAAPSPLAGLHVGVDISRVSLEARQSSSTAEKDRKGVALRAHVGYDMPIGPIMLGGEVGVGSGGRTVSIANADGGRFQVNPGVGYDISGRAGVLVVPGALVYGRIGYAWLRTRQSASDRTGELFNLKRTNAGLTFGGGIEVAIAGTFAVRAEYTHARYTNQLKQDRLSFGTSLRF